MDPGPSYSNYLNIWHYVALPAYIIFGTGQAGSAIMRNAGPSVAIAGSL